MKGLLVLVADSRGTAIANATVMIDDVPTRHIVATDATGQVYVEVSDIPQSHLWIAAAGYQPYSQHLELPPHNVQLRVGVPADPARTDIILPGLQSTRIVLPRLHVEGLRFVTEHGEPWTMGFTDGFRDYERFLRSEDIRPLLEETVACGGNGRRVFGSFDFGSPEVQRLYPREHVDYYDRLEEFFALYAQFGLYMQFTAFADTQRSVPGTSGQSAHWSTVCNVLRPIPHVLLERVNEQDSHENGVDAQLSKPEGICASFGSNGGGADPPGPYWDYADLHPERPSNLPKLLQSTTTLAFAIYGTGDKFHGTHVATVASEPIGFADVDQPGKRTANAEIAYYLGLGCRWGAGGTAHSDCGIASVPLSATQRSCVEAFLRGVKAGAQTASETPAIVGDTVIWGT